MARSHDLALGGLLTACVAYLAISTDMYLPALPAIAREFGVTAAATQWTLSAFLAGFAAAQLVYGPLSDRYGRKPVLVGGLVVYLLATIACIVVPSIEALIAMRFVQALGACAAPTLARAIVRDIYEREHAVRMLAYIGAAMGLIPGLAPILGGFLIVSLGWRAVFVFLAAFSLLTLLGVLLILRETNTRRDPAALNPRRMARNYRQLASDRRYLGYVFCLSFGYGGLFMYLSGSPFVMIEGFGIDPQRYGAYFIALSSSYIVGTTIAGRLAARLDPVRMISLATLFLLTAAGILLALALGGVAHPMAMVLPMCLYLFALGLVLPNALVGAIGPYPEKAGLASALLGFVQLSIAGTLGVIVVNVVPWSQLSIAVTVALAAATASFLFAVLTRRAGAAARPEAAVVLTTPPPAEASVVRPSTPPS